MRLINGKVYLENNYPLWIKMYYNEEKFLKSLLEGKILTIEHVGSTAIRNLDAKPIIDILIGVNDIDDIKNDLDRLKKIYTIKIDNENKEILLIKENNKETFYLIHILHINDDRYKEMIMFKNILNKNKEIKNKYLKLKQELALKYPNKRKIYTMLKSKFIEDVLNNNEHNMIQ